MADKKLGDQDVTAIDKALAAAKARKDAKANNGQAAPKAAKEPKAAAEPREPKRPRISEEEKAARQAQRDQERAARKEAREQARAEKLAARIANKQPAHMRKVMKAAEKLSPLGQAAMLLFNEATTNLTAAELTVLADHIQHFNRVQATERALSQVKVDLGQTVTIVGGNARYVGKTGTVVKAQRIRCYVNIPGANNRPVPGTDATGIYFFTSDVSPVAAAESDTSEAAAS